MGTLLSYVAATDLEGSINSLSLTVVGIGSVLLILFVALAILVVKKAPKIKAPLFIGILLTVVGTTFTIAGGTIYLNLQSYAGGPVHWHADYEVWACGNELDLRDPHGLLSNKIGTPTLHEHNDKRIHLEGVPVSPKDASLGKFMTVVGGEIGSSSMVFPLNDDNYFYSGQSREDGDGNGAPAPELVAPFIHTQADGKVAKFVSGEKCGDETAEVQTFVYKFDQAAKTYEQSKVSDPANYVISGHGDVPPGDCVIMEFAPRKDRTTHLCKQYGIRDKDRCAAFGVPEKDRKICEDTEVKPAPTPTKTLQERCREAANKNIYEGISAECAKAEGVF